MRNKNVFIWEIYSILFDSLLKPGGAWFKANDVQGTLKSNEEYTITVMFCPRKVGSFVYKLPLILNEDIKNPYRLAR